MLRITSKSWLHGFLLFLTLVLALTLSASQHTPCDTDGHPCAESAQYLLTDPVSGGILGMTETGNYKIIGAQMPPGGPMTEAEFDSAFNHYINEGSSLLDTGNDYRGNFHNGTVTIAMTLSNYQQNNYQSRGKLMAALRNYETAVWYGTTSAETDGALLGMLDAAWEIATGEMLMGNQAMVDILDMRFIVQYPSLCDRINRLIAARDHFTQATSVYLDLLATQIYPLGYTVHSQVLALQTLRINPLDGSSAPFVDVQRLAEASAAKSRAYLALAESQFRLYTPVQNCTGKAAAEATLREGFHLGTAELALLAEMSQGWGSPSSAYQAAYQALTQNLADMGRLFEFLQEGKNPFGYDEAFVPFEPVNPPTGSPLPNFEVLYDKAMHGQWVGYDKAKAEYDALVLTQRDLDDDEAELYTAMTDLDAKYTARLEAICGSDSSQTPPVDLANCHLNTGKEMYLQIEAIKQAQLRLELVQVQMANQLQLIRIEQERAAAVAGIHRATAVMYEDTYEELASLARKEVELQESTSWFDTISGVLGGFISGGQGGKKGFDLKGAIIGGGVNGISAVGGLIEEQINTPDSMADIVSRRNQIEGYQKGFVEYAEADIVDAKGEALIQQYFLELAELELEQAIAINQLGQEIARLDGLKTEVEYLLARWNEAQRVYTELFADPAARILRDKYAQEAAYYFNEALQSAYLAGRSLDYEMAEAWPDQDKLYGMVALAGSGNLEGHLATMKNTYDAWFAVTPQPETTAILLSEAMGFIDSIELVGGVPVMVTAQEKFQRYVSDPANWADLDDDGTNESLQLTFQTTLFANPPQFFSNNVYNDKILYYYIVLDGDESKLDPVGNDTKVQLVHGGTSFIRDQQAHPRSGADSFRPYSLEPTRAYGVEAIYNRPPDFNGDTNYRGYGLYWRSVASTEWVLTIDRVSEPKNFDVDLTALDEIKVHIKHRNFPLASPFSEAEGTDVNLVAESPVSIASTSSRSSLTTLPDARYTFAGTLTAEQPVRLPPVELSLTLEERGSSVNGVINAAGLLGYPVDPATDTGPPIDGTVNNDKYFLSSVFTDTTSVRHQLILNTVAISTTGTITGTFSETLFNITPEPVVISGTFQLFRSALQPLAAFSADPSTGPAPLPVIFSDWSTGIPISWLWDFGDGNTSTLQNPSHQYLAEGSYDVTLTVTNSGGFQDTLVQTDFIVVTKPGGVAANFLAYPRSGSVPLTVNFTDQSAGGPTSWLWDFGDGDTSTQQSPTYTYTTQGTYTVTLTVTNNLGSDVLTELDYINVTAPAAPVAYYAASPRFGTYPLIVHFTDLSLNNPTSWLWDFGDGHTSAQRHPSHTYLRSGSFDVSLTVSNNLGTDTVNLATIVVQEGERIYLPVVRR